MTAEHEKKAPAAGLSTAEESPQQSEATTAESIERQEAETRAEAAEADETVEEQIERLTQELAAKAAEAAENADRYLRERAELENFKKRMQREKSEALRFAIGPLVRDLLPVIDNLERAIEHAETDGNGQPLVEGVRLVLKSALDVLERHGVSRMEAGGQPFDPAHHEAIARVPDPDREPNLVVQQFLAGYSLHERVLRAAQVSVSIKPPVENQGDDD